MPPELHYHEGDPGAYDAHRMMAQLYLMEIMGTDENSVEKWIGKYGKKFAELVEGDPELGAKLAARNLSMEEISALRDEFLSDKIDTGDEDHTPGPEVDA
jgi:hypothetical protein